MTQQGISWEAIEGFSTPTRPVVTKANNFEPEGGAPSSPPPTTTKKTTDEELGKFLDKDGEPNNMGS